MTVTLSGNGVSPFDEVTLSTDAASVEIDIRDDASQNIILVTGTVGADTDSIYGRFKLLDSGGSDINNARGRLMSSNTTSTSFWNSSAIATNYYGLGNDNSDSDINGERMSFMVWITCSQNASEPFYDVGMQGFIVSHGTGSNVYLSRVGNYYEGIADPRKFKVYFTSGNVTTASLKSYIIGTD
jgi:hypothetical protein